MERSWRAGQVQELESANTIADGISVTSPFREALFDLLGVVDDILLVDDDRLVTAMRWPTGRSVSCSNRPELLPWRRS
jgi:threonine dehydratase